MQFKKILCQFASQNQPKDSPPHSEENPKKVVPIGFDLKGGAKLFPNQRLVAEF